MAMEEQTLREADDLNLLSREELLAYVRVLEERVLHDPLTALPNRALLADRLEHAIAGATRRGTPFAVLVCDVDRFKSVNDRFGHEAGDVLLRDVAQRIRETLRASDTVARMGGDEFAVVLPDTDREGAELVIRRIAGALRAPVKLGNRRLSFRVSVGASIFPQDGTDAASLLRVADRSMYAVKTDRYLFMLRGPEEHRASAAAEPADRVVADPTVL